MKRKLKSALSLLLCMIMVFGALAVGGEGIKPVDIKGLFGTKVQAAKSDLTYDIYTYRVLTDNTVTITGCDRSAKGAITIPSQIDGKPVTCIGYQAFWNCNSLTNVTIPNSVTTIYNYAFQSCYRLKSISLGNEIKTIGEKAFEGCSNLSNITLPTEITSIGYRAFYNTAYYNNASNWEDGALYIGNALVATNTDMDGKSYAIKKGTTMIATKAFEYRKVTSIELPSSLTNIGESCFEDCNLTSIVIPDTVTTIGNQAFCSCDNLSDVTLGSGLTSIGRYAFSYCRSLKSITIPNGVKSLDEGAFNSCSSLVSVKIGSGITVISDDTFYGCENLTSIVIPDSVTEIGRSAFYGCNKLESITIPKGVTEIGYEAFQNCGIKNATLPDSVTKIDSYAFQDCKNLTSITIPDGVTEIDSGAFDGCSKLESVTIPKGMTVIGYQAFQNCGIKNIIFHNGITKIESDAFSGCNRLKSVIIPSSVTELGINPFHSCSSLEEIAVDPQNTEYYCKEGILFSRDSDDSYSYIEAYPAGKKDAEYTIPSGVRGLFNSAFEGCKNLKSITIPDTVQWISSRVFYGCTNLKNIIIPDNIISIGEYAFVNTAYFLNSANWDNKVLYLNNVLINAQETISGACTIKDGTSLIADNAFCLCKYLTKVTMPDSLLSIGDEAFKYCSKLETVTLPNNLKYMEFDVFYDCSSLESITIPGSVRDFTLAFRDCTGLKSVTINNGVSMIDSSAFYNCRNLERITIPESIHSIESSSFYNCENLKDVYFEGSKQQWDTIKIDNFYNQNEYLLNATIHFAKKDGFTITYNANGGSGAPGEQSTDEVNGRITISSQIPHRDGYEFIGWATSPSASKPQYSPKDTVSSSRDLTLYAVWEKSYLLSIKDIYSFPNDSRYFFKRNENHRYQMLDSDFEKLCNYVRNIYEDQDFASTQINKLQNQRKNVDWYGSCFGMSLTAIFNKTGKIDFNERYGSGAASMSAVAAPNKSAAVRSAINYYQLSQHILVFNNETSDIDSPGGRAQMRSLIDDAKNNKLILFSYNSPQLSDGHAIVIVGYSAAADGGHTLIAYDNRYAGQYININVSSDLKKCTLILPDKKEDVSSLVCCSDFSDFDMIDIDGPNNDMRLSDEKYNMSSGTLVSFNSSGAVTVKNSKGQTLTYKDGEFGGDMEILSKSMIVRSTADGSPAPEIITVNVKESDTFTFEGTDKNLNVSLTSKNIFANVETTADKVVISENEGIHASGNDISFNGSLSLNNSVCDMLEFDGQASGDVKMTYSGDGIIVDGANGNGSVTVYSNVVDTNTAKFNTDCSSIKISGDGSGVAGNVEITASSKNDGVYDVKLAEMQNRKFAFGEKNVSMYYKATGSVAIASNEEVIYTSSNPDIVSVDASGNITALKTGSATITAIEADSGKSDTCTVTVKYAWWQILIRILLLGFLWY